MKNGIRRSYKNLKCYNWTQTSILPPKKSQKKGRSKKNHPLIIFNGPDICFLIWFFMLVLYRMKRAFEWYKFYIGLIRNIIVCIFKNYYQEWKSFFDHKFEIVKYCFWTFNSSKRMFTSIQIVIFYHNFFFPSRWRIWEKSTFSNKSFMILMTF